MTVCIASIGGREEGRDKVRNHFHFIQFCLVLLALVLSGKISMHYFCSLKSIKKFLHLKSKQKNKITMRLRLIIPHFYG